MKKLLAALLFAAFLTPDAAWATYSCFGTNRPCDAGIRVTELGSKPLTGATSQKVSKKKSAKKTAKKNTKKTVKKKKAKKPVIYCEPAPTVKKKAKKTRVHSAAPAETLPVTDLPPVSVPAPEATPAPVTTP